MILAGIDEAGYGPVLGPLVVGCCAVQVPDAGEPPDLWRLLHGAVSRKRDRAGRKLHINDSKAVYTPSSGLRELERSILCLAAACHGQCESLDELIVHLDPDAALLLREHRWYGAGSDDRFPIANDPVGVRLLGNALAAELKLAGAAVVHLGARVAPERYLNRMFNATRNKSSVLFTLSAMHLARLLDTFGRQRLLIHCDRQGGREHYGSLLRLMFEDWSLTVASETEGYSEYELQREDHRVTLVFREKAESQWLPVAAASMVAKYLREALMHRFNAFWAQHAPGIAPTAGYYTDGMRFLQEIETHRRQMQISDEELIRSR